MNIAFSFKTILFLLVLFSAHSNANIPKLLCNEISELQPKILTFDNKYRMDSKEYLIHKNSSDGWVHERYLFLGEHKGQYIIAGLGNQKAENKISITKLQFDIFISKFNLLLATDQFTVSVTEHNHCNQFIMQTSTVNYNLSRKGLINNLDLIRLIRELDNYLFL